MRGEEKERIQIHYNQNKYLLMKNQEMVVNAQLVEMITRDFRSGICVSTSSYNFH